MSVVTPTIVSFHLFVEDINEDMICFSFVIGSINSVPSHTKPVIVVSTIILGNTVKFKNATKLSQFAPAYCTIYNGSDVVSV